MLLAIDTNKRYHEVAAWDSNELMVVRAAMEYREELREKNRAKQKAIAALKAARGAR